jgi:molybdenum cofactor biosynthesis enzyme MoaA
LRSDAPAEILGSTVRAIWQARHDRYSEERGSSTRPKSEMSYLGG